SGRFYDGDSFAVFRPWARELRARGISRVNGDLYLAHGLFEARQIHPEWPREQLASWYEAPIDALSFSDNCVLVRVIPAAKKGAPRVELVPHVRGILRVENSARTTTSRRRQKLIVVRHGDVLSVSGSIHQRSGPLEVWVTVPDPVQYFGAGLVAAFAEEGIDVRGRPRPVAELPGPVWERVAVAKSDLTTALRVCNKHSQNFYAESLLKLLGARRCGEGSWREGVRAVSEFLTGIGVPAGAFHMTDGSGLSRENRFTPRQVTLLLRAMFLHPWGAEFVESLPLAGDGDGSLQHRLLEPPYRGNVFAKTGTIDGVSALSGYAKAVSGKTYAFSLLLNRTRSTAAARAEQDRIVMALVDHG
ncbi:MAG TPA: D-alanyl-D-alanine carboxypeptidase/D-alanyl-D-alanine-endopeptidase, partial [Thermoanaerobaculia bacterium]